MAAALQARYWQASKAEKGRLLDDVVAVTGYHRRHAVRLVRHGRFGDPRLVAVQGVPVAPVAGTRRRGSGRPRVYSSLVIGALRTVAEASGWLCGKRLAPFLSVLVPALEAEGVLTLAAAERVLLGSMSAATIDRRLQPFRVRRGGQGRAGVGLDGESWHSQNVVRSPCAVVAVASPATTRKPGGNA